MVQIISSLLQNSDLKKHWDDPEGWNGEGGGRRVQKKKKVGKTTRPFRYDLNQISYDYTVEVRRIFKELDLVKRVPEELLLEIHNTVQE